MEMPTTSGTGLEGCSGGGASLGGGGAASGGGGGGGFSAWATFTGGGLGTTFGLGGGGLGSSWGGGGGGGFATSTITSSTGRCAGDSVRSCIRDSRKKPAP